MRASSANPKAMRAVCWWANSRQLEPTTLQAEGDPGLSNSNLESDDVGLDVQDTSSGRVPVWMHGVW